MNVKKANTVICYTDGACSGNPGPGGWAAVLYYNDHEKIISGAEPNTTNNRMELRAAIEALKALKKTCDVEIITDSEYVKKGITEWMTQWKKNQWRNAQKKPIKNQDLWQELDALAANHKINWHWVKGHSGHPENEKVDELAREALKNLNHSS